MGIAWSCTCWVGNTTTFQLYMYPRRWRELAGTMHLFGTQFGHFGLICGENNERPHSSVFACWYINWYMQALHVFSRTNLSKEEKKKSRCSCARSILWISFQGTGHQKYTSWIITSTISRCLEYQHPFNGSVNLPKEGWVWTHCFINPKNGFEPKSILLPRWAGTANLIW